MSVNDQPPTNGGVDPLWVLWESLGQPDPHGARMDREGRCSRCNSYDDRCSRIKAVVSDKFTGWDDYTRHADPLWCRACAWGHTAPELRTRAWRIGGNGVIEATAPIIAETLDAPIPAAMALLVPLSRHKHILPAARWGHVTTDDRVLPWSTAEVNRFRDLEWLRARGFNEASLAQSGPRPEQFLTLKPAEMNSALRRWESLAPWRRDTAYLHVGIIGTRTMRGELAA